MPEQIQSASMTAEWEQKLLQVEQGELDGGEFMSGMPSTGSDQRRKDTLKRPGSDITVLYCGIRLLFYFRKSEKILM